MLDISNIHNTMQEETSLSTLRTILPRNIDAPAPQKTPSDKRIKRVTAACEFCRHRRVKVRVRYLRNIALLLTVRAQCDAVRPTCTTCAVSSQACVYRTTPYETSVGALKRKFSELEIQYDRLKGSQEHIQQLLHAIRTRPNEDAFAIFQSIRAGADVGELQSTE